MGFRSFRSIPGDVIEWARYFASVVVKPDPNTVTDDTFANRSAHSVIGRPQADAGTPSDISASADHQVLIRRGAGLTFATLQLLDLPDTLATDAEVASVSAALTGAYVAADAVVTAAYIAADAVVAATAAAAISTFTAGTYTPTLTNVANLDATTARLCTWLRIEASVMVSGQLDADPTTTATATKIGISLPVASNFSTAFQCGGTAASPAISGQPAAIYADATNDRAQMEWKTVDVTNQTMCFSFLYQVI